MRPDRSSRSRVLALVGLLLVIQPRAVWAEEAPAESKPVASATEIAQLVNQLGHERYIIREHAQSKLMEIGAPTFDALSQALEHDDLEISNRARFLLGKIRFEWTNPGDPKHIQDLLKNFPTRSDEQRLAIIGELADHQRDADLRALCRIVRYDREHRVSKRAAMALIFQWYRDDDVANEKIGLILRELTDTSRTGAAWFRAFAETRSDRPAAVEKLEQIAQTELGKAGTTRAQTGPDVVARLLYLLAGQHTQLKNVEAATEHAQAALAAGGTLSDGRLAFIPQLEIRGYFDWAKAEYEKILEIEPGNSPTGRRARRHFVNLLHDQGDLERAANAQKDLVELIQRHGGSVGPFEPTLQESRAQMNYLFSLHYEQQGETTKQTAALTKAASQTAIHPDIMIAMYRLPDQSDQQRQQTRSRILNTVNRFRTIMKRLEETSRATGQSHNQFAWLVGNTLGETDEKLADEAIGAAQKALKFSPNSYAYTDTLARCYYSKGDLDSAIKYQKEALALNPHSGLLQTQLKLFEEKLAQKSAAE